MRARSAIPGRPGIGSDPKGFDAVVMYIRSITQYCAGNVTECGKPRPGLVVVVGIRDLIRRRFPAAAAADAAVIPSGHTDRATVQL